MDYILYITVTKGLSNRTVQEYYLDVRLFLKYLRMMNDPKYMDTDNLQNVSIKDMPVSMLNQVQLQTIYEFLFYIKEERENQERARGRKASSLKSFFGFMYHNQGYIDHDPTDRLELPYPKKCLPRFLTLEQSKRLLESIDTSYFERDYCIIALFLNCGIRLSELVNLNTTDLFLKENKMCVLGKGNKERIVYLNDACMNALEQYLAVRRQLANETTGRALFLSKRHTRISKRRVQQIVENALTAAGLNGLGYSTHKLRHTAATLMYQYGHVDALTLKEVLGHVSTSTTEIYTHLSDEIVREATESSPLADFSAPPKKTDAPQNHEKAKDLSENTEDTKKEQKE
ncbi:MAG: tyrosine-type recombinase/integrase [Ruminococcus sp.]